MSITSKQIVQKNGVYLFQLPQGMTNYHALVKSVMKFHVEYKKGLFLLCQGIEYSQVWLKCADVILSFI